MEMEYGVGITNRYAFLDDDVDDIVDIEALQVKPQKKEVVVVKVEKDKKKKPADKAPQQQNSKKKDKPKASVTAEDSSNDKKEVDFSSHGGRDNSSSGVTRGRGGSRGGRSSGGRSSVEGDRDKENFGNESSLGSSRMNHSSRGGKGGFDSGYGHNHREKTSSVIDDWGETVSEPQHRDFASNRGRIGGRGKGGFDSGYGHNHREKTSSVVDDWGETVSEPQHRDFASNRGRSGGRGNVRGGFTRRRDFDRISGSDKSGVKSMDKRDGAGAHNWGTYKDEIPDEPEFLASTVADDLDVTNDWGLGPQEKGQGDVGIEIELNRTVPETVDDEIKRVALYVEEEEPILFTLEQWKAMQQPKSAPKYNIRMPNEGADPCQWKNLVLKKKVDLDEDDLTYDEEDIWVPQRAGRLKRITDIGFHFVDDRVERTLRRATGFGPKPRGDGDAGNVKGSSSGYGSYGRGRGGSRGYRRDRQVQGQRGKSQGVPRVDDAKEWPSLNC